MGKRMWCCQHLARACPSTTSLMYECKVGSATQLGFGWSKQKQVWCCTREHLGCPPTPPPVIQTTSSTPYDCSAGFSNWQRGWSDGKKRWCCTHAARGCPH